MADRPIFPGTIKTQAVTILPADTTTPKDLITAGANGSKITGINITSDDTAIMVVQLWYHNLTTAYLIGSVSVPTLAGTDGTVPSVSLLNSTAIPSLGEDLSLMLEGLDKIQVSVVATVTTAKTVTVVASYGDY